MIDLQQQLNEQLTYSTVVANHLADALIYIEALEGAIQGSGDIVSDIVQGYLPKTDFNYEKAASACVQSEEEAIRGIKADAVLSVTDQGLEQYRELSPHTDGYLLHIDDIEAYAEQVREG